MKWLKRILVFLVFIFITIQFFPAEKNNSGKETADISKTYHLSPAIYKLLKTACYDCHSNFTYYPWYAKIQPMGWWLADHIRDGKEELNFNEFGAYSQRRQVSKLKAIAGSLKDGSMPLKSYTWIHKNARLSSLEKDSLISWAETLVDSLQK